MIRSKQFSLFGEAIDVLGARVNGGQDIFLIGEDDK
jgi:hypothetical protein